MPKTMNELRAQIYELKQRLNMPKVHTLNRVYLDPDGYIETSLVSLHKTLGSAQDAIPENGEEISPPYTNRGISYLGRGPSISEEDGFTAEECEEYEEYHDQLYAAPYLHAYFYIRVEPVHG